MSMTRGEAIEIFEQKGWWIAQKETLTSKQAEEIIKLNNAVNFALSALRPVNREQVEKMWRGEWEGAPRLGVYYMACSKCGFCPGMIFYSSDFCPNCGAPMTDEAVDMVMKRLGALKDE